MEVSTQALQYPLNPIMALSCAKASMVGMAERMTRCRFIHQILEGRSCNSKVPRGYLPLAVVANPSVGYVPIDVRKVTRA